jgi:2-polyprenyl-3-methyl-5-hydroxy-6-metoxy-1,4-benzoquinol methylase
MSPGRPREPSEVAAAGVLAELESSGLDLTELPGNTAKLRLALDLAAELRARGRLRVVDVGGTGSEPLNLWRLFVPLAGELELTCVDVAHLDRAQARARELGLQLEVREGSALALRTVFAEESFDVVVSTQTLEHVRPWHAAVGQMAALVSPGGLLLVTCDSGDSEQAREQRARLGAKRAYARLAERVPGVAALARPLASSEWEDAPRLAELEAATRAAGLEVERIAPYGLRAVKIAQRGAGPRTRKLWLALEETLAEEAGDAVELPLYALLYLRARRPESPVV